MFDSEVSLSNILVSLEGVLKIEYNGEERTEDILRKALDRLENTYNVAFTKDIYALQSEAQMTADDLNILLRDIKSCLEQLSFFVTLKTYHKNVPFTLADVNYLGYAKRRLLISFKYMIDVDQFKKHRDDIMDSLTHALDNIGMCTIKRLTICMLMFNRLGVVEGVATVAQLLYLGGLVS